MRRFLRRPPAGNSVFPAEIRQSLAFDEIAFLAGDASPAVRLALAGQSALAAPAALVLAIDDSAVADRDYAGLGTVQGSIGPGETSKTLLIPIVSDAITESTELFDVVIEDPTAGATLGAITQVTVIIVDDD